MSIVKLYCVEHCRVDGAQTYEVFRTLREAEMFVENKDNWDCDNAPLCIFSSDFNADYIYEEDNGSLSYEDCSDTMQGNFEMIREVSKKPVHFES
ncbi:MAG: hypothetical protein K2I74_07315 [Treponemataceae bacterium]|nr:hypothetical protein [Treponemataceae bacterium]